MSKNILLACSNYFPNSFGGTEIYVQNHASFLRQRGNNVYIITATPLSYFNEKNTIYDDNVLIVCRYRYENSIVFGISYVNPIDTDLIYSKYKNKYKFSWDSFIKGQEELSNLEVLHLHSFTAVIGINLIDAVRKHSKNIRVITSYHTPISCPKGTLMYKDTLQECTYKPSVKTCSDCLLSSQKKIVLPLSKLINFLNLSHQKIPAIFKVKHLVKLELKSFEYLKSITQEWWCYSNGIKDILKINGIGNNSIKMARHGISEIFLKQTDIKKAKDKTFYMFSGRIVKIKGVITLMKAWLQLPVNEDKQLWLTAYPESDNPEISTLLKLISKRKDVHFLGPKTQNDLVNLYAMAHFVIIPSEWYEIGPLVFHEAIASRCNVICSDIGGCKEISNYHSINSATFKTGNVPSLTEIILSREYLVHDENVKIKTSNEHFQIINDKV